MGFFNIILLLAIFGTTQAALPEVKCEYTGQLPLKWEIDLSVSTTPVFTLPVSNQTTVIPDGRKVCWKQLNQAQPYPYRSHGGWTLEEPINEDNYIFMSKDGSQAFVDEDIYRCEHDNNCVFQWFNSAYVFNTTTKQQGLLSSYGKFKPQLIKYGGDVPAGDYMRFKFFLTDADCALSIEEIAAKNMTQWYPEGGYFRIVKDDTGMLKYEGTGTVPSGFSAGRNIFSF